MKHPSSLSTIIKIISFVIITHHVLSAKASEDSCTAGLDIVPYIQPRVMISGEVFPVDEQNTEYDLSPVYSCTKQLIGMMPQFSTDQSIDVLDRAKEGWNKGRGDWAQMSLSKRIEAVEQFMHELQKKRDEIVNMLMYEIGKNFDDARNEFDRTILFIQESIEMIKSNPDYNGDFHNVSGSNVFIRRNAFGIVLVLGPYNYPLNETYATMIPALLMGNTVILKIPAVGGLSHLLSFEAFSKAFPPNTIHFISGSGRMTLPPLMQSGDIDGLAFIGGASTVDKLIRDHPRPHRLKLFLQLDAKNMAILLPDMIDDSNHYQAYPLSKALDEIISGSLSFNGQRCTALKIVYCPKGSGHFIANELAKRVETLTKGMPWELHKNGSYSKITPLPNDSRVSYMEELIADAVSKGGRIANPDGGKLICHTDNNACSIMNPAVIYDVNSEMRIFNEEQFGPIVPIVEYESLEDVLNYGIEGVFGQQVSIFTNKNSSDAALLIDAFSTVFGKLNINSQCGRSPDNVPFSARRSSGLGVMSIEDALKEFSIPTVVSYKHEGSVDLVKNIVSQSSFMQSL